MAFEIKKGASKNPPRIMIIGTEGIGKSTAGAQLPKPLFICAENGLIGSQFSEVESAFPKNWADVLEIIDWLCTEKHEYKSLVFDTSDWLDKHLEDLVISTIVHDTSKPKPKKFSDIGYGRGPDLACDHFRGLLSRLERLNSKGMIICFLTHAVIKPYKNPEGEDYDRFEANGIKKVSALIKQWCDVVLFAHFQQMVNNGKGVGGQSRIVETEHHAAWDAKNRYNLPSTMTLDMPTILTEIEADGISSNGDMEKEFRQLCESMDEAKKEKALAWLDKKEFTTSQLSQQLNRARAQQQKDEK